MTLHGAYPDNFPPEKFQSHQVVLSCKIAYSQPLNIRVYTAWKEPIVLPTTSIKHTVLNFSEEPPCCFHRGCTSLQPHQQWMTLPFSPQPLQHLLLLLVLLIIAILTAVRWYHIVVLICVSLIAYEVENLFAYLLAICMFSREKCLFRCPACFSIGLFVWY